MEWWLPGAEGKGSYLMGGVSVWEDGKFWRQTMVTAAQQCECTYCHRAVHLDVVKMVNYVLYVFYHDSKN